MSYEIAWKRILRKDMSPTNQDRRDGKSHEGTDACILCFEVHTTWQWQRLDDFIEVQLYIFRP
jgi:hypothetical protein